MLAHLSLGSQSTTKASVFIRAPSSAHLLRPATRGTTGWLVEFSKYSAITRLLPSTKHFLPENKGSYQNLENKDQRDGPVGKSTGLTSLVTGFEPWDPHTGGRREQCHKVVL